ncbi:MAG TPA: transglutaminase family protein [Casimicrobiaceae bacterium]|nr:transglutaminase family protein [Casimicrobiaceae bacterium]
MDRRRFLTAAGAVPIVSQFPLNAIAQTRSFTPMPGEWRTFETVTRVDVASPAGLTQVWIPVPQINNEWQTSEPSTWTTNAAQARLATDASSGAQMVHAVFADSEKTPWLEVTSRVRTQDRTEDWSRKDPNVERERLAMYLQPTELMPIDGIVLKTARDVTGNRRSDFDKAQAIYDWIVMNTYREPKVRGCGVGDIKAMLETGNMGGKCGDINALFVGLSRASRVPARDLYGIRVAPSKFGYKELGAGSADISRAQHCRAEVWLAGHGWVAMDPADVGKVMRLETAEWLKTTSHPVVAPVNKALFGGWEGNWMAYNDAHDVALPGSKGARLGFFMYPAAETRGERIDSLDPDTFKYKITVREIKGA